VFALLDEGERLLVCADRRLEAREDGLKVVVVPSGLLHGPSHDETVGAIHA
jgi:hypothetical protein